MGKKKTARGKSTAEKPLDFKHAENPKGFCPLSVKNAEILPVDLLTEIEILIEAYSEYCNLLTTSECGDTGMLGVILDQHKDELIDKMADMYL